MDTRKLTEIIAEGENTEVEFKQSFHSVQQLAKVICAFANTAGGLVILGLGPDGKIMGLKEDNDSIQQKISAGNAMVYPSPSIRVESHIISGKRLLMVVVNKADSSVFHSVGGVIYVRIGSTVQRLEGQSILEFLRNRQILLFDESIEPSAGMDDIDRNRITAYLERRGHGGYLAGHSVADFLASKKFLSLQPEPKIKNIAILFFGKEPQMFFPHAQIKLVRFDGTSPVKVISYEIASGSIPEMIEHAINFVKRFVPREFVIKGLEREEIPSLPVNAFREAIINAAAHRDYFNRNEIQVSVFDDRVEITNPGGLPEGMEKEMLGVLSVQRNPGIYQLLKDYGYMEGIGSGISRIYRSMEDFTLQKPDFFISKEIFRITLRIKRMEDVETAARLGLNARQVKGMEYMKLHGKIKSSIYASINSVSVPSSIKDMKKLEKLGLVKKVGKYRGAYYVLNKEK